MSVAQNSAPCTVKLHLRLRLMYAAPVQEKKRSIVYSNYRQDVLQGQLQRSKAGGAHRSPFKLGWFASWVDDLDDRLVSSAFWPIIIGNACIAMVLARDIRAI